MIRSSLRIALAVGLVAALGGCQSAKPLGLRQSCPKGDHYQRPRNAAQAEMIAKRMITDVLGAPSVVAQEPFTARLDGDRWLVQGTPRPGEGPPMMIMVDASTGCPVYVGRTE